MNITGRIGRAGITLVAAAGLAVHVLVAQVPAVQGRVESCIDPNTRALISCSTPAPAAGTAVNSAVGNAATALGQALGQALIRQLFSSNHRTAASAPQPDTAAIAAALRRAQFARDKNELMAALGLNGSDSTALRMEGSAPAQLQLTGPPPSAELHMAAAPPPPIELHPPEFRPTPLNVVATIHLRVGDHSLLVAAPRTASGVDVPFAVCRFRTDNAGVVTVNDIGQVAAVGPGLAHVIESCNGGAVEAAISIGVAP